MRYQPEALNHLPCLIPSTASPRLCEHTATTQRHPPHTHTHTHTQTERKKERSAQPHLRTARRNTEFLLPFETRSPRTAIASFRFAAGGAVTAAPSGARAAGTAHDHDRALAAPALDSDWTMRYARNTSGANLVVPVTTGIGFPCTQRTGYLFFSAQFVRTAGGRKEGPRVQVPS